MKTAQFIEKLKTWYSDARLFKLSEPMAGTDFVIVSAVNLRGSGPETCIFPANAAGVALGVRELDGSFRGELNHKRALNNAGYDVESVE